MKTDKVEVHKGVRYNPPITVYALKQSIKRGLIK